MAVVGLVWRRLLLLSIALIRLFARFVMIRLPRYMIITGIWLVCAYPTYLKSFGRYLLIARQKNSYWTVLRCLGLVWVWVGALPLLVVGWWLPSPQTYLWPTALGVAQ